MIETESTKYMTLCWDMGSNAPKRPYLMIPSNLFTDSGIL